MNKNSSSIITVVSLVCALTYPALGQQALPQPGSQPGGQPSTSGATSTVRRVQIPLNQLQGFEAQGFQPQSAQATIEGVEITLPDGQKMLAFQSSNCGQIKDEITASFRHVRFGLCSHPLPPSAQAEAAGILAIEVANGNCRINEHMESGHRTVSNSFGPIKVNSYLAYAGCGRR